MTPLDAIHAAAARILSNTGPDSLPPNTRADAVVLARAWVELLSREPTGRVETYRYTTPPDRDVRIVLKMPSFGPDSTGTEHFYEPEWARRLGADLIRAAVRASSEAEAEREP